MFQRFKKFCEYEMAVKKRGNSGQSLILFMHLDEFTIEFSHRISSLLIAEPWQLSPPVLNNVWFSLMESIEACLSFAVGLVDRTLELRKSISVVFLDL